MLRTNIEFCPHCKTILQGEPIPKEIQRCYGATHYTKKIKIHNLNKNIVDKYGCPKCAGVWDRFMTKGLL